MFVERSKEQTDLGQGKIALSPLRILSAFVFSAQRIDLPFELDPNSQQEGFPAQNLTLGLAALGTLCLSHVARASPWRSPLFLQLTLLVEKSPLCLQRKFLLPVDFGKSSILKSFCKHLGIKSEAPNDTRFWPLACYLPEDSSHLCRKYCRRRFMGLVDICLQPSPRPSISSELPRSFLFPPPKMHIQADFGSLLAVP